MRSPDRDFVYHSDAEGAVQLPVENRRSTDLVIRAGGRLGKCRILSDRELQQVGFSTESFTSSPCQANSVADRDNGPIGCQRPIREDEIIFGSTLSTQRSALMSLINEFTDVFASNLRELGRTHLLEADIKLKPDRMAARSRPYRLAPEDREFMEGEIQEWRDAGIVTDTQSPFASPAFVVTRLNPGMSPKKRVVVDIRRLNDAALDLHWPIPNIEDELMDVHKAKLFAQLHFRQGFMQIPLAESARKYTAFITPDSSGGFTRLLFGFKNGPAIFNHLVSLVLGKLRRERLCFYFFDDVLVKAADFDDLLRTLREVFSRVRSAGLTLHPEKCRFGVEEVLFMALLIR